MHQCAVILNSIINHTRISQGLDNAQNYVYIYLSASFIARVYFLWVQHVYEYVIFVSSKLLRSDKKLEKSDLWEPIFIIPNKNKTLSFVHVLHSSVWI